MDETLATTFGVTSAVAPLERVLVRRPATAGDFAAAGWRSAPDPVALAREHEAFCALLADLGAEVTVAEPVDGLVDAVYMYDSAFTVGDGAIVLSSAKPARAGEDVAARDALALAGVPVVGALTGDARADGGDLFWLDSTTLAAGRGYRTNAEAHRQLAALLEPRGARVERFDLPHDRGAAHVLHLMSVVSPVADDLAVVFEPLAPVTLLEALDARQVRRIPVDADEYETLASNVLPVRPGVVVVVDGNPRTRRALEAAGCEVHPFTANELSLKGDGGPTCLTRPLLRR